MKSVLVYFLKISLTGILFLPVYLEVSHLIIYESFTDFQFYNDTIGLFIIAVLAYLIWFLPSWLLLFIAVWRIMITEKSYALKKLYLIISVILLTGITTLFIYLHAESDEAGKMPLFLCLSCAFSQLTSALIFKPLYIKDKTL
jgi:hypothetical protein